MFQNPLIIRLAVICLCLVVLFVVYRKTWNTTTTLPSSPVLGLNSPLDWAVQQFMPLLRPHELYMRRLSLGEFAAYCESRMSACVASAVRARFQLWALTHTNGASNTDLVAPEHHALYSYLRQEYQATHPEQMSAIILRACYRYYHNTHSDAVREQKEFELFKQTAAYQPQYAFDVRFANEVDEPQPH